MKALPCASFPVDAATAEYQTRINKLPETLPPSLPQTEQYLTGLSEARKTTLTAYCEVPPADPHGYVYFAEAVGTNRIKIGFSVSPDGRVEAGVTWCPHPLRVLKVIPGGREEEQRWHHKYAHLRVHGEWFEGTKELRSAIAQAKPAPGYLHLQPEIVISTDWVERCRAAEARAKDSLDAQSQAPSIVPADTDLDDEMPAFLVRIP
jgi:Meiotically up-regulated gene 113